MEVFLSHVHLVAVRVKEVHAADVAPNVLMLTVQSVIVLGVGRYLAREFHKIVGTRLARTHTDHSKWQIVMHLQMRVSQDFSGLSTPCKFNVHVAKWFRS